MPNMLLEISGEITPEKNEAMEPKQKQHLVVDVTGDESKVRCCKEQYCIGSWNVRSMNQGKLEVVNINRWVLKFSDHLSPSLTEFQVP